MSIQANLKEVLSELPAGVRLVAVSKFHPNEALEEAYAAGQRIFGESHVQEMTQKYETLPKDIEWHFIGHLQTNKVITGRVKMCQVDGVSMSHSGRIKSFAVVVDSTGTVNNFVASVTIHIAYTQIVVSLSGVLLASGMVAH